MSYCADCKVRLKPNLTQCPYCDSHNLEEKPPDPSQGSWTLLPIIPGIVEAKEVGGELEVVAIQYFIDQAGDGTAIQVGQDKYDQALEIQETVLEN